MFLVIALREEGGRSPDKVGDTDSGVDESAKNIEYRTIVRSQVADAEPGRLAALEERIATLEQESKEVEEPPAAEEGIDAKNAETYFRWEQRLDDFSNEPRIPSFAKAASAAYDADFDRLAERLGFQHLATDCRSNRCKVDFQADEYSSALRVLPKLVHNQYQMNCAVQVTAPPPEDGSGGPYKTSVLFDCSDGK